VDFKDRTAKPVFSVTNNDIISQSAHLYPYLDGNPTNFFLLMTHETIRLFDGEIRPVFTLPYQRDDIACPRIDISILEPTNGSTTNFAVWFYPNNEMNEKRGWTMPIHVLWLGPVGNIVRRADLPVLRQPNNDSWEDKFGRILLPPLAHLAYDKMFTTCGMHSVLALLASTRSSAGGWRDGIILQPRSASGGFCSFCLLACLDCLGSCACGNGQRGSRARIAKNSARLTAKLANIAPPHFHRRQGMGRKFLSRWPSPPE